MVEPRLSRARKNGHAAGEGMVYDGHADAIQAIADALARLRFGYVKVVVQDGRVVQIETTEKLRL